MLQGQMFRRNSLHTAAVFRSLTLTSQFNLL